MSTSVSAPAAAVDRHRAAVSGSLRWAQESADRNDYADALGWIRVLEAIGERIPPEYQDKRRVWGVELVANNTRQVQP